MLPVRHDRDAVVLTCFHLTRSRPRCPTPFQQPWGECKQEGWGGGGGGVVVFTTFQPPCWRFGCVWSRFDISGQTRQKSGTICTSGERSEERQVFPNMLGWLVCARMCARDSQGPSPLRPTFGCLPLFFFFQIRLCIQTDGSRLLAFFSLHPHPATPPPFNSLPLLTQTASPPHHPHLPHPRPHPPTVPL